MNDITISKHTATAKKQLGQGMTEYMIIVALVAVGAIGVYSAFGHTLQGQMAQITNGIAGQTKGVGDNAKIAKTQAGNASTAAKSAVGLDTYGNNVTDQ